MTSLPCLLLPSHFHKPLTHTPLRHAHRHRLRTRAFQSPALQRPGSACGFCAASKSPTIIDIIMPPPTARRLPCCHASLLLTLLVLLSISTTTSTAFLLPSSLPHAGAASRTALTATPSSSSPDPTPTKGNWLRAASLLALTILPSAIASPAGAFDAKGVKLFENNCASCHVGGGNIIG